MESTKVFDIKSKFPMDLLTMALDTFMLDEFVEEFTPVTFQEMEYMCLYNRVLSTGSFSEHLDIPGHIKSSRSDNDFFLVLNNDAEDNLFNISQNLTYLAKKLNKKMDNKYPGYFFIDYKVEEDFPREKLKLFAEKWILEIFPDRADRFIEYKMDKGPAIKFAFADQNGLGTRDFDFVPALYHEAWPDEAREWIKRKRASGWPTKCMITNITQLGFHAVNKEPTYQTETDKEQHRFSKYWRISFSIAEVILSQALNPVQRQCIRLMKVLNSHFSGKILCSFHIKTLAFWVFEEIPIQFWKTAQLGELFLHMVDKLWLHVIQGKLSHYFIPTINLFHNIPRQHLRTLAKQLLSLRHKPMEIFLNILGNAHIFRSSISSQKVAAENKLVFMKDERDLSHFNRDSRIDFINFETSLLNDNINYSKGEFIIDENKLLNLTIGRQYFKESIFETYIIAFTFYKLGLYEVMMGMLQDILDMITVFQCWFASKDKLSPPSDILEVYVAHVLEHMEFEEEIQGFTKHYLKLVKEKDAKADNLNVMEWYHRYLEVLEIDLKSETDLPIMYFS